jgi:glycosyltransferase involved in cell wall biosynthesis
MIKVSIIIPTRNRASYLKDALVSTLNQSFSEDEYEIIVVDNGSTDDTKQVVEALNQQNDNRIRYFYDAHLGLHVGRHLGAKHARGDILLYADDDILASPDWVKEIHACYSETEVGAAGGKIIGKFETKPPEWVNPNTGYLSLLDLGDDYKEINTNEIYGCNLSIRKNILFELGGFHPDAVPQNLIRYRGDGESALMFKVVAAGYKTVYNPRAYVYHVIPSSRLTIDYFKRRAFNQGVSDSFSKIRANGSLSPDVKKNKVNLSTLSWRSPFRIAKVLIIKVLPTKEPYGDIKKAVNQAYWEGYTFHQTEVKNDPELLAYVLKEDYFV